MKIGILGGSFNPIHMGHLIIAQLALDEFHFDKILFIPTNEKVPHKDTLLSNEHRCKMVSLAIHDNKFFELSDIECKRQKTTYTIDTVKNLPPGNEYTYIIGYDTLTNLHTWKNIEDIHNYIDFIVLNRGLKTREINTHIQHLEKYKLKISYLNTPNIDISSSDIRKRVKCGCTIKYLVPKKVEKYISKNFLYEKDYSELYNSIDEQLSANMKKTRYNHTLGVIDTAVKLGKEYGVSENQCKIAAILHDYTKEWTLEQHKRLSNHYHVVLDISKDNIMLHGQTATIVAKYIFNIKNKTILNAIEYHTTGRTKMSTLEKIIYLSDAIEPNRDYAGVNKIRDILYNDGLDEAIAYEMNQKLNYLKSNNQPVDDLTVQAYNYIKGENNEH